MAVGAVRKVSIFDRHGGQPVRNVVCIYWLAGRCNRNPCRFMHRDSPPPQCEQSSSLGVNIPKPSRKRTWRNPNYDGPKTVGGAISCNEGGLSSTRSTPHNISAKTKTGRKIGYVDQEMGTTPTTAAISSSEGRMCCTTESTLCEVSAETKTGRKIGYMDQGIGIVPTAGAISSNKGRMSYSTKSTPQKDSAKTKTGRKIGDMDQEIGIACPRTDSGMHTQPMDLTAEIAEPENVNIKKALPKQCEYWVASNCVHGDNCKDLHSWFYGCGFTMLAKLKGHGKAISGISLPSGCDNLYSGCKDGSVRVWDCNSGQCAGYVNTGGEVGCLISEGPWLFVGLPNAVKAWNLQSYSEFSLSGPDGLVCCMVMDNDKLFAGVEDGTILVWKLNPETNIPEPAAMLKEHPGAVCSLVIGANRLYSGSRDCTIKVWDLQNLHCMQTLHGHTSDVMAVLCWDCYLISASLDNTLKVWSATESGTIEVVYEIKEDCGVIALCGLHDAEVKPILLCSYSDNTVRLYDLRSFTERGRIFSKQEVQVIRIGVDGLFFTGDATGEVSVWKLLGPPCAAAS